MHGQREMGLLIGGGRRGGAFDTRAPLGNLVPMICVKRQLRKLISAASQSHAGKPIIWKALPVGANGSRLELRIASVMISIRDNMIAQMAAAPQAIPRASRCRSPHSRQRVAQGLCDCVVLWKAEEQELTVHDTW